MDLSKDDIIKFISKLNEDDLKVIYNNYKKKENRKQIRYFIKQVILTKQLINIRFF